MAQRTRDRAAEFARYIGPYLLVKRSWESSVAIFLNGSCVETARTLNDARAWVKNNEISNSNAHS